MRTRRRLTWIVFIVCILAVLEGLGWVTWHALRLERSERAAQATAQFQQSIRLALWRMESEVTPIIAAEAARPYFHYIPFYPAERAYTKMFQQIKPNELRVPSPLLEGTAPYLRLHYQIESDGTVTSPQAPTGNMRDLAEAQKYVDSEYIVLAGQMLGELTDILHPGSNKQVATADTRLRARFDAEPTGTSGSPAGGVNEAPRQTFGQVQEEDSEYKAREKAAQTAQTMNVTNEAQRRKSQLNDRAQTGAKQEATPQTEQSDVRTEAAKRVETTPSERSVPAASVSAPPAKPAAAPSVPLPPGAKDSALGKEADQKFAEGAAAMKKDSPEASPTPESVVQSYQAAARPIEQNRVEQGPFESRWCVNPRSGEDELILERIVHIDGNATVQGLWVDWPLLRGQFQASIADLLPGAALSPAGASAENESGGQRLAAIPVRLLPGPMPVLPAAVLTPTHVTLMVTWAAVIGAICAIGVVLRKAMELSERRGRFVSAVTHELRTPLTTFCLYTEMLADGMVGDETAQRHYLGTLKGESNRLARIVQNVLDYAGIGGVARKGQQPTVAMRASELVSRLEPALTQCAQRSGMSLEVSSDGLGDLKVRVDPQTVERILLNLVENSGKYAGDSADKRIHFEARREMIGSREWLELRVRDHGPGVPKSERRKIFQAFHRASRDAQSTKSGLGLGLALARELAAELGGRLALDQGCEEGAEFVLRLPTEA